jgi:hypothetical protein
MSIMYKLVCVASCDANYACYVVTWYTFTWYIFTQYIFSRVIFSRVIFSRVIFSRGLSSCGLFSRGLSSQNNVTVEEWIRMKDVISDETIVQNLLRIKERARSMLWKLFSPHYEFAP